MSVSSIRRPLLFIGIAVLLSCWATLASAQETRGSIGGRILDTSGAVVPGAAVTATNAATNVAVKTTTNSEGNYDLPFLISGVYTVTANAAGFKAVRRQQIELRIHDRLQLDLTLEVGAITEQVEVTAAAPILETSGANIGQVIDARRVAELPNLHGSPFSLIYLSAGVTSISAFGAYTGNTMQNPIDAVSGITVTNVNGAPPGSSDITMDGIPNTQAIIAGFGSGMANSPPADIVQEFKLEQAFDASVGHTTGTVINVSLKTGANQPHGTAYLFHQDPSWNANSFFANRAGQPKGDFTYNRWGTTLSGPVYIPKLYKGKDHTFFTYGYEGLRQQTFDTFVGPCRTRATWAATSPICSRWGRNTRFTILPRFALLPTDASASNPFQATCCRPAASIPSP